MISIEKDDILIAISNLIEGQKKERYLLDNFDELGVSYNLIESSLKQMNDCNIKLIYDLLTKFIPKLKDNYEEFRDVLFAVADNGELCTEYKRIRTAEDIYNFFNER